MQPKSPLGLRVAGHITMNIMLWEALEGICDTHSHIFEPRPKIAMGRREVVEQRVD